jgi:transcriptional regulator GlxA family with amidase domain
MKTLVALAAECCMASCPELFADMAAYADRALGGGAIRALVATKGGSPVTAFGGRSIAAQVALESVDGPIAAPESGRIRADALCLPVPLGNIDILHGDRKLAAEVRRIHSQSAIVAAPCASVFLLAEAGMIEGRRVPVHPGLAKAFAERYPRLDADPRAMYRDDPDLLCSVGSGSTPELGVMAIRRLCGSMAAAAVAKVFLDRDGAARLATLELEEAAGKAAAHVEAHYPERLRLTDLAAAAGLEERTLSRRFVKRYGMSPMDYLRLARCRAAAELLCSTDLSLEEIAWKVGYAEASSFARAFKAAFGKPPAELRRR